MNQKLDPLDILTLVLEGEASDEQRQQLIEALRHDKSLRHQAARINAIHGQLGVVMEDEVSSERRIMQVIKAVKGADSDQFEQSVRTKILEVKNQHNSIGGVAIIHIENSPIGLGEPIYYKLDAILAEAMMGINGVKAVEIGAGVKASKMTGKENNDEINENGFVSNNAGGILGGISNGETVEIKVHFKPTPSIFQEQKTQNIFGETTKLNLKGRHDPVIAVRGSVVAEAMASVVILDMLLLNMGRKMEDLKKYYS